MKKFSTKLNGYDKDEVNSFVNEVAKNYEEILNNLKEKDRQVKVLAEKLTHFTKMESTLNKAIFVAEDAGNQIKRLAREEATLLVDDAKRNASRIINTALLKAEKTENEAESLQRKVNVYKRRVKQIIEEQLAMVDEVDDIDL